MPEGNRQKTNALDACSRRRDPFPQRLRGAGMDENHHLRARSGSLTVVPTRVFHPARKEEVQKPDRKAAFREKASGLPEHASPLLALGTRKT